MSETAFKLPATKSASHSSAANTAPRRHERLRAVAWHLAPWLLPALLFALWTTGCEHGWIAPQILPPPERVYETFIELAKSGDLAHNTLISLQRVLIGFGVGTVLGFVTGAALGLWQPKSK